MCPDIVVHAALRWPTETAFEKLREADIDMALEVNLSATLHLTRLVLPTMKERGGGTVIVVSPDICEAQPLLEKSVSGASQAFVEALHAELADDGIIARSLLCGEPPFTSLVASILQILETAGRVPLRQKSVAHINQGTRNAT
jgi:short-subunit dehydrogenase